ncbi:MAG TPA: preprotein translocase subunit SecG [Candidatus Polarisedimenticolia bacterium]|nr:preprotein translocase subunit SecG [Candidatus Polarisedimenticolia bacterium]
METKTAMKWALALLVGFAVMVLGFRFAGWLLKSFFVLNCLVLIIVVLLQSGKAADLAGAFGGAGSQTAFGPRGAANVLSKATTWCAIMFMVCAFAMVLRTDKAVGAGSSVLEKVSQPAPKPAPVTTPAAPATSPATAPSTTPATSQPNSQPASQPPGAPATKPTTSPSTSQRNSKPASPPPAASQPAPAQPKKP